MIYEIIENSTGLVLNENEKRPHVKDFKENWQALLIYLKNAYRAYSRHCFQLFKIVTYF